MVLPRRARCLIASTVVGALGLVGCGSDHGSRVTSTTAPLAPTTSTTNPVGPPPPMHLTTVATLDHPTAMAQRDGDDTLYVAEKTGGVRAIDGGAVRPVPVLDLHGEVSDGTEQGLLGLAFAPHGDRFTVDYTDAAGDTHVVEYSLGSDGTADLHSRRELLVVKQPYPNHNGGQLAFGPDGKLYIGLGDGGSEGDPQKNAQNLTVLLGKILRIDPTPSGDLPYTIPFDNPFAKQAGARGEIWAYGLRNPWRFSFDRTEHGIWIGDVGQGRVEEIDHVPFDQKGGQDYGWSLREGTLQQDGARPKDAIEPVAQYEHKDGACSITGGYVYRGSAIPSLWGRYVFADYCNGKIMTLTQRGTSWDIDDTALHVAAVASFGEDHHGELYVLSQDGTVGRLDGD